MGELEIDKEKEAETGRERGWGREREGYSQRGREREGEREGEILEREREREREERLREKERFREREREEKRDRMMTDGRERERERQKKRRKRDRYRERKIRNHFYFKLKMWGQNPYFAVFSKSLVCIVGSFVLIYTISLHTIQDLSSLFSNPFIKMFKFFFEMPIFIVFGGLAPIGWTSKPLLQSSNFRSFYVILASKVFISDRNCFSYVNMQKTTPKMYFVLLYKHLRPVP